jgi:phenylacetate-CoA ligase
MANHVTAKFLQLRTLLRNRHLPAGELRALQENKLRAVVRHAYENVPYYRSLFDSAGLSPDDIRTVEDLTRVPVTTKDDLQAAGLQRTVARGTDLSSCVSMLTSGTTGKPFRIYLSHAEGATRLLNHFRAVYSIGFGPRDRMVILGPGETAPQRLRFRLGLFRTDVILGWLSVDDQIRRIRETRPTLLWCYPTNLHAVLHALDYRLSKLASPRILITSSEVLPSALVETLRADLDMDIFNLYGCMEMGRIAVECTTHEGLHVNADQLILECLADGQPAALGQPGQAVITSLSHFVMPFIRYHLGDICSLLDHSCSCGCSFPLMSAPRGRDWDMIQLPSGRLLSPSPSEFFVRGYDWIHHFLLVQESRDHIVLQLVLRETPGDRDLLDIQTQFTDYIGEPVGFEIQIVDSITEKTEKVGSFVCKLPPVLPPKPSPHATGQ